MFGIPRWLLVGAALAALVSRTALADEGPVLPFAEDAAEMKPKAVRAPAASKPVPAAPSKSGFQPRFKAPNVRRAAHDEPAATSEPVTTSQPAATPKPAVTDSGPATGPSAEPKAAAKPTDAKPPAAADDAAKIDPRALIDQAFAKSKTADGEREYTEIIDLCQKARAGGLKKNLEDYFARLLAWAHNRRGEAFAQDKKDKEALADFETAVTLNPQAWRAIHNRGVSYAALGKLTEALADFDRTIQLNDTYANAYFNRAQLRYTQRDYRGAIDDYASALELGSPDAGIFNNRGHAYYRLERFGEALRDYAEALRIDPKNAPAMINRADAFCDLGRYGEAAKDYQAAVEADPKSGRAYQSVAWLMATCPDEHYRDKKLAVDAARKALELDGSDNYRALETLAAAQANAGQFDEAKATQEKAIAKTPRSEMVSAEKRMGLYQRELAYRERPKPDYDKPEDEDEKQAVRRAAAYERAQKQAPPRGATRPKRLPPVPMRGRY